MFTVKLYQNEKSRILEAESFTIVRTTIGAEITLHQKDPAKDARYDVGSTKGDNEPTDYYDRAIIENMNGKTTEMISAIPIHRDHFVNAPEPYDPKN